MKPSSPSPPRKGKPNGKRHGRPTTGQKPARNRGSKKVPRHAGKPDTVLHYGLHTVRAALTNPNRQKIRLFATPNALGRLGSTVAESSVNVEPSETATLDAMTGPDAVHQGVVLECRPLEVLDGSELFALADARLLLVLDQITDPHNVGAILRSAVAMNVDAVLLTHRHGAAETGALAKAASGALDMVKLVSIRTLAKAVTQLREMGFVAIGLDSDGDGSLEAILDNTRDNPLAIVLGAEGKGLREQTRAACTALARLDMPGPIRSLNVSNAAALALYMASGRQRVSR